MHNKSGFTLVEIIMASVIFVLVIAGLLSVFVAGNKQIIHVRERITSAELGKLFVDPLQMDVSQATWDQAGNKLIIGSSSAATQKVNNRNFSATYTVADATTDTALTGTDLRRVTTQITWNEPSP
jgi:Tfp pilus assembly protein PilW